MFNKNDLFASPDKISSKTYADIFEKTQKFIVKELADFYELPSHVREKSLKSNLKQFLEVRNIKIENMTKEELVDKLYEDLVGFGFLTKYLNSDNVEEIDIDAWNSIYIQYSNGAVEKTEEHFTSPEACLNMTRRMLQSSNQILDNSQPIAYGSLGKNIRITAMKYPIVEKDIGACSSIRIVNPKKIKKEEYVKSGFATREMLDFVSQAVRYGISICVAGATSSGKTTLLSSVLSYLPDNKRVYCIEEGARELNLVKYNDEGTPINSIISTLARKSENKEHNIDQITLLDAALRFNPDVIAPGEMRGPEANAAQEAARTGIAVVTSIHALSAIGVYPKMVSLCKRGVDMKDETLLEFVTEAYPIVIFAKQLESRERKLMEIMECEIKPDGSRHYHSLWEYEIIESTETSDGRFEIIGEHKKVNNISKTLQHRLLQNGMPKSEIEKFITTLEKIGEVA